MQRPKTISCLDCHASVPVAAQGAVPKRCLEHRGSAGYMARDRVRKAAAGLCIVSGCEKAATAGVFCPKHRKANAARSLAYRRARRDAGMCAEFGCALPAAPGHCRCATCAKAHAAACRRLYRAA